MCPLFWPTWFVILFMATKVTEKISHPTDCTTYLALWLSSKSTKSFTHTIKTFIQLKIMKKRLLMCHKNNSLSDSWLFPDPDSASVISVVSRDAMAVSLSIPMSSLWMIFAGMKRKKSKWNSIGEKEKKTSRKSLMKSKPMETKMRMIVKNKVKRKAVQLFKNASNYLRSRKFWANKTLGIALNAKILYWPKSKCKFIKPQRFWSCVWKDSREKSITPKSSTCNFLLIKQNGWFPP